MDFANIANIPKELTALPRWVCWRLVPDGDGGKPKKVPYSALTGKTASVDRPAGWTDFETAAGAAQRYGYSGLGFVFVKEDGLVGIDMDDCYDQEKAEFSDTARAVLSRTATYAEFSPSGTGVHVFFRGSVPERGSRNAKTGVEMYEKARYFTMTGNKIKGAADGIAENEDTLRWIHENYIAAPKKEAKKPKKKGTALSDDELLGLAKNAANGLSFGRLWEGKWQNDYPSQSEADMALCCNLAFWSGRDAEQMDRLFRRSGLMRPKWDERHCAGGGTYGEQTLSRACELTDNVYSRGEIYESGGRYFRSKGDSAYPLTNFIFRPQDKIEGEEETQLTADLVNTDGESFPLSFMTADFTNQQKFKTTLNKRTIGLSYFGNDGDLEAFKGYINRLNWRCKTGVRAMGIHEHGGKTVYVSTEGAVDAVGDRYDEIIQLESYRSIDSGILKQEPLTADGLRYLGQRLMSYNEPAKAVSILAWVCGCFIKEHLRKKNLKFPHLMLVGESGSGKSTTLERIVMPVFSRSKIIAAGQTTNFTLLKDAASSNIIPVALDEFKPSKLDRARLDTLLNYFRNSYDMQEGFRGRANQSIVSYWLTAPLVAAGEESANEPAVRERTIELLFSKKDLKDPARQKAFTGLCRESGLLGSLGRSLLNTALATPADICIEWYKNSYGAFSRQLPSRIRNNLACMAAGLRLARALCVSLGSDLPAVFPFGIDECLTRLEYAAREYLLDGGMYNKSVVDQTLEIMSRMRLDPQNEYAVCENDTVLALWLNAVYDKYTKYRRDHAIECETLEYSQFKRQLANADYFIAKNVQKRLGATNRRVWTLNYGLLKERCDVSGFETNDSKPM